MSNIDDIRQMEDFKSMSFSGYKLSAVKKELLLSINNNRIENICYWTGELICSGHYLVIWELILLYMSKYIHTGNIKLCLYLELRFNKFKDIINKGYVGNEIRMRNNEMIRRIFLEIMCVLSYSNKKYEIKRVNVPKEDYCIENLKGKLKAVSLDYAKKVFEKNDPNDLYMAINEFMYHLEKTKDIISVCYWIEWILQYEMRCKKNKEKCEAHLRTYGVEERHKTDIIWIIWDCYKKVLETIKENKKIYNQLYNSLLSLFSIRYTASTKRKRIYILYLMASVLTEKIDLSVKIINNKDKIDTIVKNNDRIFKLLKKNEVLKKGKGVNSNSGDWNEGNLENTFKRLEMMDKISIK
jgi:hypothetical protein